MGGLESVWNKNKSAPFCPLHGLWNYPNYTQKLPVFLSKVHTCVCACAHTHKEEREHLRRSIAKSPPLWWKSKSDKKITNQMSYTPIAKHYRSHWTIQLERRHSAAYWNSTDSCSAPRKGPTGCNKFPALTPMWDDDLENKPPVKVALGWAGGWYSLMQPMGWCLLHWRNSAIFSDTATAHWMALTQNAKLSKNNTWTEKNHSPHTQP